MQIRLIGLLIILLNISCTKKSSVEIYGQWHLSPNDNTLEIDHSKKLPQFKSQIELYQTLVTKIKNDDIDTVIAEGCEGNITNDFTPRFNGWTMEKLSALKNDPEFKSILAPVAMKLKIKFPDLDVRCGDSLKLIKKNQLAFSEVQGHLAFFSAFIENYRVNQEKYQLYKKNYLETINQEEFSVHPIILAKDNIEKNLELFLEVIKERNDDFVKSVERLNSNEKKVAIIIGKIHVSDLQSKMDKKFHSEIIPTLKDDDTEEVMVQKLKEAMSKIEIPSFFVYSQMPAGFSFKDFPIKNKIPEEKLLNAKDKDELLKLSHYYRLTFDFFNSDFDKDNIRDFTLSEGDDFLVIASEDSDWDNDGASNLIDPTVGDQVIAKLDELKISNTLKLSGQDLNLLKKWFEDRKINLINDKNSSLEFLNLYLFKLAYELFKTTPDVSFIRGTSYTGDNRRSVFFAYIKQTKTIEFYTTKFLSYLNDFKNSRFKDLSDERFIKEVASPLILQSLIHELAHSQKFFEELDYEDYGFSFEKAKLDSLYLSKYREPSKVLTFSYEKIKYQSKGFNEWMTLFKNRPAFKDLESYQSLLEEIKIPSLYALTSMDEWESEIVAACGLLALFPKLNNKIEGKRWELLIDFNPYAIPPDICKKIDLRTSLD